MTLAEHFPSSLGYQLAASLREDSSSSVNPTVPNESAREDLLLRKLGARGWGRIHHFRNFYTAGWGDREGRPLSPRALEAFFRFLSHSGISPDRRPSVFLTDDGHLELCWDDASGKGIELEFTPHSVECYREATGTEDQVSLDGVAELATRLSER